VRSTFVLGNPLSCSGARLWFTKRKHVVSGVLTGSEALLVALAGGAAGFINAIVGSGTLISFPVLAGVGFEKVLANMANSVGLTPGSVSAAYGYRNELKGQKARLTRLIPASTLGAITGAVLLLKLPATAFQRVVPFLILLGVVLVIAQPFVQANLRAKRKAVADAHVAAGRTPIATKEHIHFSILFLVFLTGIYGGYFGAGQGVILVGMLGMVLDDDLQRINATKNVLAAVVNGVAAIIFIIDRPIPWVAAGIVAVSSVIGAQLGSKVGRRIPPNVLRGVIALVGIVAATKLFLS
jgi:uncharacterized protein